MRRAIPVLFLAVAFAACSSEDDGQGSSSGRQTTGGTGATDSGGSASSSSSTSSSSSSSSSSSGGADAAPVETFMGEATYYNASGTGACGTQISDDQLLAAINDEQYTKANCGRCASVQGPNGTVVVKIVDKCPGCKHGDLDLSSTAFAKIAKLSAGRVKITWHFADCP